jgi:membrane-bound inhibitor of C-type lysozyme
MASVSGSTVTLSWKNPTDADLDYVKIQRRLGSETVTVVTRDTPVPGATDTYEELNVPEGTYTYDFMVADLNGNVGNVVSVEVVVGAGGTPTDNRVKIGNRIARVGGVAKPAIILNNADQIAGVGLKLTFDNATLILTDVVPGAGAAGLSPVSAVDIDAANTSGELVLDMIDLSGSDPVMPGSNQKIAVLEFTVDSSATAGTVAALTLSDVSLSDPNGDDVVVTMATDGSVTVQDKADTDLNDDGSVNIGDIWFYLNMEEMVQFESLAELIVDLLAQPMPTSLAAVQDATATNYRVDSEAALIDLTTDYEIVAARFTFSYDTMYQFESIGLNPALAEQMMIKKVVADGKIYVDVIALGGFVPAEVGSIFSVAFRDTDHQTAGLTLEQVQTADRDGNVRIEAAKVNRIALPKAYSLSQNSPNPFNPSTTIKYQVPEGSAARVQIVVYNIRGQKVVTLVDELKESGDYSVNWNGQSSSGQRVSSGVYFYRMSAGEFSAMRKMVIVK